MKASLAVVLQKREEDLTQTAETARATKAGKGGWCMKEVVKVALTIGELAEKFGCTYLYSPKKGEVHVWVPRNKAWEWEIEAQLYENVLVKVTELTHSFTYIYSTNRIKKPGFFARFRALF